MLVRAVVRRWIEGTRAASRLMDGGRGGRERERVVGCYFRPTPYLATLNVRIGLSCKDIGCSVVGPWTILNCVATRVK
jgi:hypothetical protein